jgi:NADH-quinone oxidoreductase subunit C
MGTPGDAVEQNFDIIEQLTDTYPEKVSPEEHKSYPAIRFDREIVTELMELLKDEHGYEMLSDLHGADFPDRDPRLEVIYNLYNLEEGDRLLAMTGVPEDDPNLPTVTPLWKAARWYEREVYDMYGVNFEEHPQHKRVLLYEEFEGHPLRKDYPKKKRQPLPLYYEREDNGEADEPVIGPSEPPEDNDAS